MSPIFLLLVFIAKTIALNIKIIGCPLVILREERCKYVKITLNTLTGDYLVKQDFSNLDFLMYKNVLNKNQQIKVVLHGYGGLKVDYASRNITEAYRSLGYYVFLVDYSDLALTPCYLTSVLNSWHVAKCVAGLAISLVKNGKESKNLHLIGFSLGAHISGFAAYYFQEIVGKQLGRITGLDPALPFFSSVKNNLKLDKSDASFVDIIHTNAGVFGKIESTGHVDFYINNGVLQPQCNNKKYRYLCSHLQAGIYFSRSIYQPEKYKGTACKTYLHLLLNECKNDKINNNLNYVKNDTYILMGEHAKPWYRGVVMVKT